MKLALLRFEEEIKLLKLIKNVVNAKLMKDFVIFCGDDHIVHVDAKPSLCYFFLKDVIHHCLKHSWGVGKAKEYDCQFKQSFTSFEGGFILVAFLDPNVIVSPANIKLGE